MSKKKENVGKKPIKIEEESKKPVKVEFVKTNNKPKIIKIVIIVIALILAFLIIKTISKPSIETIKNSVVKIEVYNDSYELIATGSGFCAYKSNYIVTNFHVIEGAKSLKIIIDDKEEYDVNNILIFDVDNDLALLDTSANLNPLKLGSVKKIKSGEKVTAIGSPLGELNTVSTGIISNATNDRGIQISASISHGSSGGALFDKNNKLIGITYATLEAGQNLNYAISIDYLQDMYNAYKKGNYEKLSFINCIMNTSNCIYKEGSNILSYADCSDDSKGYYSFSDFDDVYSCTNPQVRYDSAMKSSSWENLYADLSDHDKEKAVATYEQIHEQYYCKNNCNINDDIEDWNVSQFMINLGVLKEYELSFIMVDINNYNGDNAKFNRLEKYPLDAYQKALILNLIGDRSWNNIHRDNKRNIFDYFNGKGYSTVDLGAILEILGYEIVYENDGTLTAYWR